MNKLALVVAIIILLPSILGALLILDTHNQSLI
jgi:hypothetical protein